jgi:hypothetical protein
MLVTPEIDTKTEGDENIARDLGIIPRNIAGD